MGIMKLNGDGSNALSLALRMDLSGRLARAGEERGVRGVILASEIPKYFSSGLDLEELFSLPERGRSRLFMEMLELYRQIIQLPKPVTCAIGGYALLGGWILALACDFRFISEENGRIALSEIKLGISPTTILVQTMMHLGARQSTVKEMIFLGKTLKAPQAAREGLVDKMFPADGLLAGSLEETRKLTKMSMSAFAAVKKSYRESLGPVDGPLWRQGQAEFGAAFGSVDSREGFRAALEKRRPVWR